MPATKPTKNLPAKLGRYDWIDFERTDGTVGSGFVVYDRDGTICYLASVGQGQRWVKRDDIANAMIIANPAHNPA